MNYIYAPYPPIPSYTFAYSHARTPIYPLLYLHPSYLSAWLRLATPNLKKKKKYTQHLQFTIPKIFGMFLFLSSFFSHTLQLITHHISVVSTMPTGPNIARARHTMCVHILHNNRIYKIKYTTSTSRVSEHFCGEWERERGTLRVKAKVKRSGYKGPWPSTNFMVYCIIKKIEIK